MRDRIFDQRLQQQGRQGRRARFVAGVDLEAQPFCHANPG
jgi:hypothetical protein